MLVAFIILGIVIAAVAAVVFYMGPETFLAKVFGTKHEREMKAMLPLVAAINELEPQMQALTRRGNGRADRHVPRATGARARRSTTCWFPRSPPCARPDAAILNMRHFDVQLIGGIVLHRGKIAEMKTGEGKTLVATLPVYLNALAGKGVHVVTVNDYLAKRDSEWMGRIYKFWA